MKRSSARIASLPRNAPAIRPARRRARAAIAFTLLEVMVAMVIFTLVMSSLYVSFRTAIKAFDIGMTHSELDQTARYALTQISDDLRNLFYKTANSYNVTSRQQDAMAQQREQQRLQSGVQITVGEDANTPDTGPPIDISFRATDNGDQDDISFARYQTLKRNEDRKPWGLARIRYYMGNNMLMRSIDDIKTPETDEDGNEIPKVTQPQTDKIANNVKSFSLKFGYFTESEWRTAQDWDSNAEKYRNPPTEEETNLVAQDLASMVQADQQKQQKPDDLPAWVEVSVTFTDPRKSEKARTYRETVLLPQSQETYVPPDTQQPDSLSAVERRRNRKGE
ncbi:MAG: prepilin-type N-terminal cleavage/methylation domain-containing protein [bacterium]|nr:prepilin-type N-terminal cleavage/methylation domain-containing protein [Candidatus Sumerlaeota bacterium]